MIIRLGRVAGCLALALASACADKIAPPQANAGTAITANTGSSVLLDGRSSLDPQGRALAYDWSFASRPAASRSTFNDAHIATPSFVPDLDGVYMVSLVVSNGVLSSAASQVQVTVKKCGLAAPDVVTVTATPTNPITDTTVQLSVTVHDADNDPSCNLGQTSTVLWTSVGLPTAIADPTATTTSFKPQQIGAYQFSVVATDSTGLQSAPKFITVDTSTCGSASPSIATATSSSANPNPGDVVTLSAAVTDADNGGTCNLGQALSFEWRLTSRPAGSSAALSDPTAASPTITPDASGTYQFVVTVTDSTGRVSNAKSVSFTTTKCGEAVPTVANPIATPATPNIGTSVALSATAADGDNSPSCNKGQTLTFHWALVSRPASSSAFLDNPVAASPIFTPDAVGTYQFSVAVSDGTGNISAPTFLGVTTTNCGTHAPSVTIASSPASPVPFASVDLTPTVTDADNGGTCNLGQSFTYAWTLTRPPSSVSAFLSNPGATAPSFTPDVPGAYRATLTVTDSAGLSSAVAVRDVFVAPCGAAAVRFSTPAISASFAESAPNVGAAITLTASAVDPGTACGVPAGPVQYVWTLAGPSGSSAAAFAVSAGVQFTFTPDVVGIYDVSVKAVDLIGQSASASTSVSTTPCGAAPIAMALTPGTSTVNSFQAVTLTATPAASSCPARFAPQIAWSVASAKAQLSSSFGTSVDFRASGPGDYTVSAVAINTSGHQGPVGSATVHVSSCGSQAPVVTSLSNSPTFPARKQTITLSATAFDPDAACGDAQPFAIGFELLSAPQGSSLSFAAGASSFQGDVEGTYAFRVVATEAGTGLRSDAAVLNVTVLDPDPAASSVVAVPASGAFVVADNVDSANVTVTLRNRLGQPIGALPVSVSASGVANSFTPAGTGTSDVNGVFTTALKSTKAELKTITAIANSPAAPVTLASHPSINFVAGPTASLVLEGLPATLTAGDLSTVKVTAFDAFGNVAKGPNAYRGTVQFTSNDPGATLPANYPFVSGDDGTKTFPNAVRLITAGTRTVTVTDTVNGALTASQTAVVSPAAPDSVAFGVQPSTTTAGVTITPPVRATVKDAFANLVPGASVTLSIATGPLTATLAGTTTQTTNGSGIATFANLSITKSGTYTLHAAVTGTPGATSTLFDINPAAPASASFTTQPTSATAGASISPAVAVTVKDAFANLVPGASVTVSIATNPTGATLFGTKTVPTDSSGVASFADLSIQKAATGYTLHAAVTGTSGDTSAPFNITPDVATHFTVTTASPATAGVAQAFVVTALDQFANVATGYTGSVTFTSSDTSAVFSATTHAFGGADNGVFSTGTVEFRTSGSRTIHATDGSISGTSAAVTVNPGPAATLAVSGVPSPFPAGTAQPFTVTALDRFGNIATGYTGTVDFSSDGPAGTFLPASHAFTTGLGNDNGVFVASVTLTTAGPRTVTATDHNTTTITGFQGTTVSGLSFATRAGANPPDSGNAAAAAVATFSDGSFVATGSFSGTASWQTTTHTATGASDLYTARFNSDGTVAWVEAVGTAGETVTGSGVVACNNSGCGLGSAVVSGTFTGTVTFGGTTLIAAAGATEFFLVRYDATGSVVWAKQTQGTANPPNPSASSITVGGLAGFADGSTIAVGNYDQDVTFGPGEIVSTNHAGPTTLKTGGLFLARFNPDGSLFSATSATALTPGNVTAAGVAAIASDGGAVAVGTFTTDATFGTKTLTHAGAALANNGFAVKYASDGTTVAWVAGIGGASPATASAFAAAAFADGDVAVTGSFTDSVSFGAGTTPPGATAAGNADVFVVRLKGSDGTATWVRQAGSSGGGGSGLGVATFDVDGSVAVVGTFNASPTFAFGTTNLSAAGGNDVFVARYSGTGALTSAVAAGGAGDDLASAIAGFADTGALVAGKLNEAAQATPTVSTFGANVAAQTVSLTTQAGTQDAFFAKYYPYAN